MEKYGVCNLCGGLGYLEKVSEDGTTRNACPVCGTKHSSDTKMYVGKKKESQTQKTEVRDGYDT
jgi:ribosome-binding protein aMBF1 (putative translation factor)